MLCVQTGVEDSRRRALPLRLRPVLRQDRRRNGAPVSRFAGGVSQRTMEIAERCNFKLQHGRQSLSRNSPFPPGHTIDSYFEQVCREGLKKRLETAMRQLDLRGVLRTPAAEYESRLELRNRHHQADEVLGLLPHRLGLHQVRARSMAFPLARAADRRPARSSPTAMEITNIDPHAERAALRALPESRARDRCPISTSTSA